MDRNTNQPFAEAPTSGPVSAAEIARIEARNALRQFDAGIVIIENAIKAEKQFILRPSHLYDLNRYATIDVSRTPGVIRTGPISISNTAHCPPPGGEVQRCVEELCDYVNANWNSSPIHLAAYLLWRVNWVHPFEDGNGRTSRMIAYIVLCIRVRFLLPGTPTIPEQISVDKTPYYHALDAADAACKQSLMDLSVMENLLSTLLAKQLLNVYEKATRKDP